MPVQCQIKPAWQITYELFQNGHVSPFMSSLSHLSLCYLCYNPIPSLNAHTTHTALNHCIWSLIMWYGVLISPSLLFWISFRKGSCVFSYCLTSLQAEVVKGECLSASSKILTWKEAMNGTRYPQKSEKPCLMFDLRKSSGCIQLGLP